MLRLTTHISLAIALMLPIACDKPVPPEPQPPTQPEAAVAQFEVNWKADPATPSRAIVEASGLPAWMLEEWKNSSIEELTRSRLLAVYARVEADAADRQSGPPMVGTYTVMAESGVIQFAPKYALEAGMIYRAVLCPDRTKSTAWCPMARVIEKDYALPQASHVASTTVQHIYPTANLLPENLLKFYVYFSAPMSRGGIYQHIRLLNEAGQPIELPFLELEQELWNPAMTRLTLFIDPGRIKRGVRPLEEIGPSLEAGKNFTLEILATARDAAGNPMAKGMQKKFKVSPADRTPVNPADWTITAPKSGTRDPLMIDFAKSMDHALAERMIQVENARGPLAGTIELSKAEMVWRFTPAVTWTPGNYELAVQKKIEDLAGNNVGKPFEVDAESGDALPPDTTPARIPVSIP